MFNRAHRILRESIMALLVLTYSLDLLSCKSDSSTVFPGTTLGPIEDFTLPSFDVKVSPTKITSYIGANLLKCIDIFTVPRGGETLNATITNYVPELSEDFDALFADFLSKINFLLAERDNHKTNNSDKLGVDFTRLFFRLNRVTAITLNYIERAAQLVGGTSLGEFKRRMANMWFMDVVLKKYYLLRGIIRDEANGVLTEFSFNIERNKQTWTRYIRAYLFEERILYGLFGKWKKGDMSNLDEDITDQRAFKEAVAPMIENKHKIWYMKDIGLAPYYVTIESFNTTIYLFDLDKDGKVLGTRTWLRDLGQTYLEGENKTKFDDMVVQLEGLGKDLALLWIKDEETFNVKEIHLKYIEFIRLTNEIYDCLTGNSEFSG